MEGSSSVDFLSHQRASYRIFGDAHSGLKAVQSGRIDAFVYNRPLLAWMVRQHFSGLQVLRVTFEPQNYAIVFAAEQQPAGAD